MHAKRVLILGACGAGKSRRLRAGSAGVSVFRSCISTASTGTPDGYRPKSRSFASGWPKPQGPRSGSWTAITPTTVLIFVCPAPMPSSGSTFHGTSTSARGVAMPYSVWARPGGHRSRLPGTDRPVAFQELGMDLPDARSPGTREDHGRSAGRRPRDYSEIAHGSQEIRERPAALAVGSVGKISAQHAKYPQRFHVG
jgi:hypothetical protein